MKCVITSDKTDASDLVCIVYERKTLLSPVSHFYYRPRRRRTVFVIRFYHHHHSSLSMSIAVTIIRNGMVY